MRRSMLFLPGNNPNMLINGNCLGSDAVIFDLEDAVAPDQKDAARILVRNTMRYMDFRGCEIIVRINSIDTPYWKQDIDTILPYKPNLILLPKTGCAEDVRQADAYITEAEEKLGMEKNTVGLMPLIETALGVENAFQIATAASRVEALFLGAEDLTADLRCKRTKEGPVMWRLSIRYSAPPRRMWTTHTRSWMLLPLPRSRARALLRSMAR